MSNPQFKIHIKRIYLGLTNHTIIVLRTIKRYKNIIVLYLNTPDFIHKSGVNKNINLL